MPKMKLNPVLSVLLPVLVISIVVAGVSTYLLSQDKKLKLESLHSGSESSAFDLHNGEKLPDFKLISLKGDEQNFYERKGKLTLINFWATWCGPCVEELPALEKLYSRLKEKGFTILAINADENPDEVLPSFLKSQPLSFPIFTDKEGVLSNKFSVSGLPFSLIIDKDGKIIDTILGEIDWEKEEEKFLDYLK